VAAQTVERKGCGNIEIAEDVPPLLHAAGATLADDSMFD
jgi:hypothetical protein